MDTKRRAANPGLAACPRRLATRRSVSAHVERPRQQDHPRRQARRSVRLLEPLAHDLLEWRLASGRPPDSQLVFPMSDKRPWSDTAYRNWRKRVFRPTAQTAGIQDARPYDLRHSFCSLLLAEGRTAIDVAAQMGQSPTMTLETYGHIIEELAEPPHVSAEAVIGEARRQAVNFSSTKPAGVNNGEAKTPASPEEPTGRLELPTPSLRVWCRPYRLLRADARTTATKGRIGPT
jgi:hypothetical protein